MYSVFAMALSVGSNFVAFWLAWISSISLWEEQKFTLKNLHFWDQLKAPFSSNICPDCISCHLEFQNFQGEYPQTPCQPWGGTPPSRTHPCGMSSLRLLPKILHLLKNFLRTRSIDHFFCQPWSKCPLLAFWTFLCHNAKLIFW